MCNGGRTHITKVIPNTDRARCPPAWRAAVKSAAKVKVMPVVWVSPSPRRRRATAGKQKDRIGAFRTARKIPAALCCDEQTLQHALCEHLAIRGVRGLVWFAVPNGGARSPIEAAIFKGLGVKAGVSDLILFHAGKFFALELKTETGRTTDAQRNLGRCATCGGKRRFRIPFVVIALSTARLYICSTSIAGIGSEQVTDRLSEVAKCPRITHVGNRPTPMSASGRRSC
jgi:hypothetical protein